MLGNKSDRELTIAKTVLCVAWCGFLTADLLQLCYVAYWPYRALLTYACDAVVLVIMIKTTVKRSRSTGSALVLTGIAGVIFTSFALDYLGANYQIWDWFGLGQQQFNRVVYSPITDLGWLLVVFLFINLLVKNSQTQHRVQDSERRYRSLVENAPIMIMRIDLEQRLMSVNREGLTIINAEDEETAVGTPFMSFISQKDKASVQNYLERAYQGFDQECEIETSETARKRTYSMCMTALKDETDDVSGILIIGRDVSAKRQSQLALQNAENELRTVLLSIPDFVWSGEVDTRGYVSYRYCSPVAESMTGYTTEYLLDGTKNFMNIVHSDDRENMIQTFKSFVARNEKTLEYEYRIVRADGAIRWVRSHIEAQLLEDQRRLLHGVVTDISARREAEETREALKTRLQQAQQFESLGVLAGGVAHDFNNLLVAIMGHTALAKQELEENSHASVENLSQVESIAQRAAELCQQMVAYSGKKEVVVGSVDISDLIQEMALLLQSAISKKIELHFKFEPNLPAIQIDRTQIRQVLMNLILNAKEAIGNENGTITLSSRKIDCADVEKLSPKFDGLDDEHQEYIVIEVTDSGCGMDEATLKRVFDPYYSTKFTGRGLGMAATYGIVSSHNGSIVINSEPNQGTTVSILLPLSSTAVEAPLVEQSPVQAVPLAGSGKILVVDDERIVRKATAKLLVYSGFEVVTASSGREAIDICYKHDCDLSAILLDLTMPEMNGEETYRRLREAGCETPVLFTSGFHEQASIQQLIDQGKAGFLVKPYRPQRLIESLNEMTQHRATASPIGNSSHQV